MLDILDVKYDAERYEGEYGGPEAEVAKPYVFVVFDLKCGLGCGRGDKRSKSDLLMRM